MKVINVRQRTEAWFRWREKGISASDAAVLLGESPHKTLWRLWAEKTGYAAPEDLSQNPHVQRGVKYEPEAIAAYEERFDEMLLPVCIESKVQPILKASLDGMDSLGRPVEVKCPSDSVWNEVVSAGELSEAYQLYYYQVQWQMMVAKADTGFLVFYHIETKQLQVFTIQADSELQDRMKQEAEKLWEQIEKRRAPEKDPERDIYIPADADVPQWVGLAEEFRTHETEIQKLQAKIVELKEQQKPLVDQMVEMMGEFYTADFCGVGITRYQTQRVNYKQIVEDRLVLTEAEVTQYTESSERKRVTMKDSLVPKNIVDDDVVESLGETTGFFESAWC